MSPTLNHLSAFVPRTFYFPIFLIFYPKLLFILTFDLIPSAPHTLEGSMCHWYEEKILKKENYLKQCQQPDLVSSARVLFKL